MSDEITTHLQLADLAAATLAQLSPLVPTFPLLVDVVRHCSFVMNESLDRAADSLRSRFPDIPKINGHNGHNGTTRPGFSGIQLPTDPLAASKPEQDQPSSEEENDAWEPSSTHGTSRCKALLLEVLRRAAYDWVLYRQHRNLDKRTLAHDAYIWLFEEDTNHPYRHERMTAPFENGYELTSSERLLTSFHAVCEQLDLDPAQVRVCIKKMDVRSIIASGRPPQQRHHSREPEELAECPVQVSVELDGEQENDNQLSRYESIGSVPTSETVYSSHGMQVSSNPSYLGLREPADGLSSPDGDWWF